MVECTLILANKGEQLKIHVFKKTRKLVEHGSVISRLQEIQCGNLIF